MHLKSPGLIPGQWGWSKKLYFQSLSATYQELNLSHLLSLLRARYITRQVRVKGGGGIDLFIHECMNGSIGSGSNSQYASSAPLTDSKGSGAEQKVVSRV